VDAKMGWRIADLIDQTLQKVKPGDRLLSDLSITERPEMPTVFKTAEDLGGGILGGPRVAEDLQQRGRPELGGFGVFSRAVP
jgi:hypothetical protein